MNYEEKIASLGLELPDVPEPVAEYIPAKKSGNLIFSSGQGPLQDGEFKYVGKLGLDLTVDDGYEAARICALNCLAAIKSVAGSLEEIDEIVKLRGFVNSAVDFEEQPEVINGASELMVEIFGEKGKHARSALGTSVLPRNIAVELEMVVRVK